MQIEELEQKLKNKELNNLYLLYGDETYLIDTVVKKIKTLFGELVLGINYFNLDESNIKELRNNIETVAFGYSQKLIIVKNANLLKKDAKKNKQDINIVNEYIINNVDLINESVVLIIIESTVDKVPLLKCIEEKGVVCNFELLKPVDITKRLKAICTAYSVNISENDLKYLISTCGSNMQDLINEIRKLIEYVEKDGTITKKEIDLLCTKQLDSVIFDLTDKLGKKDTKASLNILRELIILKEPVQKILITIYGHFKKIYLAKLCEKYKKDIVKALKLKPNQIFLVSRYKSQANLFTEQELEKILEELTNLDANSKIGLIDVQVGLESLLCNV